MRRPRSEDVMIAADTSDIEAEFVEQGFEQPSTIKEELAEEFIRRSRQASPNFSVSPDKNELITTMAREKSKSMTDKTDTRKQEISVIRPPAPSSAHPQAGVIISIGGKIKSLLKGSGDDKKRNVREYAVGSATDLSPSSSGLLGDELNEYLPPFSSSADESYASTLSPSRPHRSLSANVVDDSQIAFDFSLLSTQDKDSRESLPIPDVDENISRSSSVKSSKSMRNRATSCDSRPRT